jgi:hypothetical protein
MVRKSRKARKRKRKTLEDIDREWQEYVKRHPEILERQERNMKALDLLKSLAEKLSPKERRSDYGEVI